MELKDFIKKVISDAVTAVEESSSESTRTVRLVNRGDMSKEVRNANVSRITFGVDVDQMNKNERAQQQNILNSRNNNRANFR